MKNESFVHLHLHTEFSQLDGLGTAENYVKRAKELGFKALAISDHGNVDGAVKWQKACTENGIKPIFGCELYIVPNMQIKEKGEYRGHMLVLAKDRDGFSSILQMLNIANLDGFYRKPRVDFETVLAHTEGLVFSTACSSSFLNLDGGIEFFRKLYRKVGKDIYFEIMPLDFDLQRKLNKKIVELQNEFPDVETIATNDCHYVMQNHSVSQEVLLAIQRRVTWNDPKRWKFDVKDLFLKDASQMVSSFKAQPSIKYSIVGKALRNTKILADRLNCSLDSLEVTLPKIPEIKDRNENEFFKYLIKEGLKVKSHFISDDLEVYEKRWKREYRVIRKLGFVRYFLIVWEMISWAKSENIMIGPGRGSVSGSLIAWLLDITKLDPIRWNLLFERFISEERADLPDIDVDIEDRYREKVREHLADLYGKECVAGISTFMRMKSRMVIKDVGRVFEVPYPVLNNITKLIDDNDLENVIEMTKEGQFFKQRNARVVDHALVLENQIRGSGQHAAGIVINDRSLSEGNKTHLVKRGNRYVSNWDKYDCEYMGLLKLDALGLSALSVLHYALDLVKRNKDTIVDLEKDVDFEDQNIYEEFRNGNCTGIFQFNTRGIRELVQELRVDNFDLLSATTALYRPGPLRSGLTEKFKRIRNGFEDEEYFAAPLKELLKPTLGIIVYQEQIMLAAKILTGWPMLKADKFRKVLDWDKDELIQPYYKSFINGCMHNLFASREEAEVFWHQLEQYRSYLFNKSHAYAYTVISFYDMFMKCYFPAEFLCASLTYGADDNKKYCIINALEYGLKVQFPKVGKSHAVLWETDGKTLYMPFIEIKGFGEKTAIKAMNFNDEIKRDGFFADPKELFSGKMLKLLEGINAFDDIIPLDIDGKLSFDIDKETFDLIKKEGNN